MNKKQQREVLDKHLAQLVPGGFICVGEKERVDDPRCPMFQGAEGKGIYRYALFTCLVHIILLCAREVLLLSLSVWHCLLSLGLP